MSEKLKIWDKESEYFVPVNEDADYMLIWNRDYSLAVIDSGEIHNDRYKFVRGTGKQDLTGEDIYEEHILKLEDFTAYKVVKWDDRQCCFYLQCTQTEQNISMIILDTMPSAIAGNTFENPELLNHKETPNE